MSVPLCARDRVPSKIPKTQKDDVSTRDLLIETLIRESHTDDNFVNWSDIPLNFLTLVDMDIIKNKTNENDESSIDDKNDRLWVAFGRFLGFKDPIKRREVRRHLKNKWKRLGHALDLRNNQNAAITTPTTISRNKKTKLITLARDSLNKSLVGFRYIIDSECIVDTDGQTLIHLEKLDDQTAVTKATDAVNHYYFHTLEYPSHRSNEFWKNFVEHFGAYTLNNLLPFSSSNTASSHNTEHQACVNNLLYDLSPLSNSINHFVQENYKNLYEKLMGLTWGPFAPRSFGVFPMVAINYNTISDFHWDEHDEPNSLCCIVSLGDFDGGELCFPQLQIVIPLRPGQIFAFSSRLLLHGNLPVTRGIRHSIIVYFVHSAFFHHSRDFTKIYEDGENLIERDACGQVVSSILR